MTTLQTELNEASQCLDIADTLVKKSLRWLKAECTGGKGIANDKLDRHQLASFDLSWYQRETDNVEQIKTLAESTGIPVLMVAQMSKAGKGQGTNTVDRNAMTGSGEKSNRANLVVLLRRDRDDLAGYSSIVDVIIDKNTMGGTSTFQQQMQPQYLI